MVILLKFEINGLIKFHREKNCRTEDFDTSYHVIILLCAMLKYFSFLFFVFHLILFESHRGQNHKLSSLQQPP